MTAVGTDRYERSARFWLRAYPPRWRRLHGDEALAVLLDLAPSSTVPDGAHRSRGIGAREAWDLVRAGWGLRWREHPPLGRWLLYRMFGVRLPSRFRWWVADDILGPLYPWRETLTSLTGVTVAFYAWLVLADAFFSLQITTPDLPFGVLWCAVFAVRGLLFRHSSRERAWRRHVLDGGAPVPPRTIDG